MQDEINRSRIRRSCDAAIPVDDHQLFADLSTLARQHAADSCFVQLIDKKCVACPPPLTLKPDLQTIASTIVASAKDNSNIPALVDEYLSSLSLTEEQKNDIATSTIEQSGSPEWQRQRLGRITATHFHRVNSWMTNSFTKIDKNADSLVNSLTVNSSIKTPSMKHGISCEPLAKSQYKQIQKKSHSKFKTSNTGLALLTDKPFIGASPDLIVSCRCHGEGLCEIKCPSSIKDLVPTLSNIPYLKQGDKPGEIQLKQTHPYYYQVQGQMGVTGLQYCDFFVYTSHGYLLTRIVFDSVLWGKMLENLTKFWTTFVAPKLLNDAFTKLGANSEKESLENGLVVV
jgi:hypothetical protein